jgi:hypothetical protein
MTMGRLIVVGRKWRPIKLERFNWESLLIRTIALSIVLNVVAGCRTLAIERLRDQNWDDVPKYSGDVVPLAKTIMLRHAAFREMTSESSVNSNYYEDDKNTKNIVTKMRGIIWSDRIENRNAVTWKYDHVLITGEEKIEINEPIYARALVSDNGHISDFTWNGIEKLTKFLPANKQTLNILKSYILDNIIQYPRTGISQNSWIKLGAKPEVSQETLGLVKGRVNYEGEPGILLETWVGVPGQSIINGYMILSELNGRIIKSKTLIFIDNYKFQAGVTVRSESSVNN